ncbi:MAG: hypothetical protein HYW77_02130 [Parcubacteria group bacterium]|nr:hypothetical protein [Parcubacteria group bacterium]
MQIEKKDKPYFVIVHDAPIKPDHPVYKEIQRIRKEEDFSEIGNNPRDVPVGIPKTREVLVCGTYYEYCVTLQLNALKYLGYNASVYEKATVRCHSEKKPN